MSHLITRTIAVLVVTVALLSISRQAEAAGGNNPCVVYEVSTDSSGPTSQPVRLTLHCVNDSNQYTAGYATCSAASLEQVKLWSSYAVAAFLSGKRLYIYWDNTCGTRAISSIYLNN